MTNIDGSESRQLSSRSHSLSLWIIFLASVVTGACNAPSSDVTPEHRRLNVILISIDSLRADHLGAYGYPKPTSPIIDQLAAEGVVFEKAFAQSSWTAPSHKSLLRSKLPVDFNKLDTNFVEDLEKANIQTAAFVGGGFVSAEFSMARGFSHFIEFKHGTLREALPAFVSWYKEDRDQDLGSFIFLHGYDTHIPYDPPDRYKSRFSNHLERLPTPEATREIFLKGSKWRRVDHTEQELKQGEFLTEDLLDLYDACVASADSVIGEVVELLEQDNALDKTAIIIISDHGEEFWDHDSLGHGHTLYNELIQVPLIIKLPRSAFSGTRVDESVRLLDVAPTVAEIFNLKPSQDRRGLSLIATLSGPQEERVVQAQLFKHLETVQVYPWKLVHDRRDDSYQFFRLDEDPGEQSPITDVDEIPRHFLEMLTNGGSSSPDTVESLAEDASDDLKEQLKALGYID